MREDSGVYARRMMYQELRSRGFEQGRRLTDERVYKQVFSYQDHASNSAVIVTVRASSALGISNVELTFLGTTAGPTSSHLIMPLKEIADVDIALGAIDDYIASPSL